MATLHDTAIVVRQLDFSETSQIVACFTRHHGLVRLIAKGARRGTRQRFAPGLDLLELGDLAFIPSRSGTALATLTGWVQRHAFAGLRRELARLYAGLYAAELVNGLTEEGDPHAELFDALRELLSDVDGPAAVCPSVVEFQRRLLRSIGYLPEVQHCADCGRVPTRGAPAYFSPAAGGIVCRDCEMHHAEKRSIGPWQPADGGLKLADTEWFLLLDYHLRHVAGRGFPTSDALAGLLAENRR